MPVVVLALTLLLACTGGSADKDTSDTYIADTDIVDTDTTATCSGAACAADAYCLHVMPGDGGDTAEPSVPECTAAPESCGIPVTCACLPECTECDDGDGLARCTVAMP
ncbi:MAG: hypothetical protein V4850_33115 [Myxococcota bacterium]